MTLLLFEAHGTRYGLDITQVVEVIPYVALRRVAHAPPWLAGVFQHRGAVTPVVDMSVLLAGASGKQRYSTRIVVATYSGPAGPRRVGLLVENATDTFNADESALQAPGVQVPDAPYLGRVARAGETLVQIVAVEDLLPDSVRALLTDDDAA
jgi:chemotaxis-related protein WspB